MTLTFWKFHSFEDIFHIVFTSFLVAHNPAAQQQLLQTQNCSLFCCLATDIWLFSLSLSLCLFRSNVLFKNWDQERELWKPKHHWDWFLLPKLHFHRMWRMDGLHVRAECAVLKIELLLMEPRRKIKIVWIISNTDFAVSRWYALHVGLSVCLSLWLLPMIL